MKLHAFWLVAVAAVAQVFGAGELCAQPIDLELSAGVQFTSQDDRDVVARTGAFVLGGSGAYQIADQFEGRADVSLALEEGYAEFAFEGPYAPQTRFRVHEANLGWTPRYFELRAGFVDSERWLGTTPILRNGQALLGLMSQATIDIHDFAIFAYAQQTIPSLDPQQEGAFDYRGTPFLTSEKLGLRFQPRLEVEAELSALHYSMSGLPAGAANTSRFLGNTVQGTANSSQFVSDFDGWGAQGKFNFQFDRVETRVSGLALVNFEAPSGRDTALYAKFSPGVKWSSDLETFLISEYFVFEADSFVSILNNDLYGNLNRRGFSFGSEIVIDRYKKSSWAIQGKWIKADAILSNAYQDSLDSFYLGVVGSYAL